MSTPSQFFSRPIEERAIYGYRKNLIINGCGRVNQRGDSHSSSIDNDEFILDRWFMQEASTGLYNRMFGTYGTEWMFGIYTGGTVSFGADDYLAAVAQKIEAQDLKGLENGGTLTLSFNANVPIAGTYSVGLYLFGASDNYRIFKTVDLTTTLTPVEMTFEIPSGYADPTLGNEQGLQIDILGFGGSNRKAPAVDTWYTNTSYRAGPAVTNWTTGGGQVRVSDVQLEFGSDATEFERRHYGEELALCQRYYWQGGALGAGNNYQYAPAASSSPHLGAIVAFPVAMREVPTVTYTGGAFINCSDNSAPTSYFKETGGFHRLSPTAAGIYRIANATYYADAEL